MRLQFLISTSVPSATEEPDLLAFIVMIVVDSQLRLTSAAIAMHGAAAALCVFIVIEKTNDSFFTQQM